MKTAEDLFKKYSNLCQFEEGAPEYLVDLEDFKAAIKENEEANAFLRAESKNMYQHIKWIVEYLKNADSVYIEKNSHIHRDCEEILNRINKQ